jgi:hypothetical protein
MINDTLYQGIYTVTATQPNESADPAALQEKKRKLPLAVNLVDFDGGVAESDLTPITRAQFDERREDVQEISWVGAGESISLAGATISGQNTWILLVLAVLLLLLAEILILAWPAMSTAPVAQPVPQAAGH